MTDDKRLPAFCVAGQSIPASPPAPGLYVVATPIGNLADITLRALSVLASADAVYCEDTRHSATLFEHYGIKTPRRALHEHNERERIGGILAELEAGATIALISDAGTPLLSDPGFPLVRAAREAGLPVFAVPGASALLSALAVAGLPSDSFAFFGFLPAKAVARGKALMALRGRGETLVFYESPRRLGESLAAMAEAFGTEREAAVALELTKRFERVFRGPLGALAAQFSAGETKGEAVVLVAGAGEVAVLKEDWLAVLDAALRTETLRAAVDITTEKFGLKRKEVYDAALARKARQP